MDKSRFLVLLFICTATWVAAQQSIYVGVHGGLDFDQWELSASSDYISKAPITSSSFGLLLGKSFNENFAFETGLTRKYYYEGYQVRLSGFAGTSSIQSNSTTSIQIPAVFTARLLTKSKQFAVIGRLGYHFSVNSEFGFGGTGSATISSDNDSLVIEEVANYNYARTFGLVEAGLGAEFITKYGIRIGLSTSYFSGFKTLSTIDLTYQHNTGPKEKLQLVSKGDYFAWHVGIRVPFSAFKEREELPVETEF